MTNEEAIDILTNPEEHWSSEREEAIKVAISAIRKLSYIERVIITGEEDKAFSEEK